MRIMLHNYTSDISTEPLYLTEAAKDNGHDAYLWSNERSSFDAFDFFKPDLFIEHFGMLSKDTVKRLTNSNIKIAINVTGANKKILNGICDLPFKVDLIYQNFKSDLDVPVIDFCSDTFMSRMKFEQVNYSLENLFVVIDEGEISRNQEIINSKNKFHMFSPVKELGDKVDSYVSMFELSNLYKNYENVYVMGEHQMFYDAALYGSNVSLVKDNKVIKTLEKDEVILDHTPYNRLSEILGHIEENNGQ